MSTVCPQCRKLICFFTCSQMRAEGIILREKSIVTISCPLCRALIGTQIATSQHETQDGALGRLGLMN